MRYIKTYEEKTINVGDYLWMTVLDTTINPYPCVKVLDKYWDDSLLIEIIDFDEGILELLINPNDVYLSDSLKIERDATNEEIEKFEFYKSAAKYNL